MKYLVMGDLRPAAPPPSRQREPAHEDSLDALLSRGGMCGILEADSPKHVSKILRAIFLFPLFEWNAHPLAEESRQREAMMEG